MSEGTWRRVADAAEFDAAPLKIVDVDGETIVVCKVAGAFHAVEDRCSHDDGPLGEGKLEGCALACPRHGAKFDVTNGAALSMPAVAPIRSYPVKVENGAVFDAVD